MIYFRAFRTRGVYASYPNFREQIHSGMLEVAGDLGVAFYETCAHWKKRPDFAVDWDIAEKGIGVDIIPSGPVAPLWWWHNNGVEGRTIRPKRHRQPRQRQLAQPRVGRGGRVHRMRVAPRAVLRFRGRDGEWVYRRSVEWKGLLKQNWTGKIATEYNPTFRRVMESASRRGVRAAQWG